VPRQKRKKLRPKLLRPKPARRPLPEHLPRERIVERIDALFAIEREINGAASPDRVRVRNMRSRPLVGALETWLRERRAKLSGKSETAKAIDYSLKRWPAFRSESRYPVAFTGRVRSNVVPARPIARL
jgi:hypothetical protein